MKVSINSLAGVAGVGCATGKSGKEIHAMILACKKESGKTPIGVGTKTKFRPDGMSHHYNDVVVMMGEDCPKCSQPLSLDLDSAELFCDGCKAEYQYESEYYEPIGMPIMEIITELRLARGESAS